MDSVIDLPIRGPSLIDQVDSVPLPLPGTIQHFSSAIAFPIPFLPRSPFTFDALHLNYIFTALTISAHHLYLTGDISREDPLAFCKPAPQTQLHRDALIKAVCSGEPKFFL